MSTLRTRWAFVSFVVLASLGCGGTDQLKVHRVSGKVTLEGKPMLGGGSISFMPLATKDSRSAGGTILDDGTYTITTYQDADGAVAGEYRVLITQVTVKEPANKGDGSPIEAITVTVKEADRIPDIYSAMDSPLKAKVEAKDNQLDFDLKRK